MVGERRGRRRGLSSFYESARFEDAGEVVDVDE